MTRPAVKLVGTMPDGEEAIAWACPRCRLLKGRGDQASAEQCCICRRCGTVGDVSRFDGFCSACDRARSNQRVADRRARFMAITPTDPASYEGPVFIDDDDTYYASIEEAAERVWDQFEGEPGTWDPTVYLVHPCTVTKASTIDFADRAVEGWGEEVGEDYGDLDLTPATAALVKQAQAAVEGEAPEVWYPDQKRRLVLPNWPDVS